MTRLALTTRIVKPVAFVSGLGPLAWLLWGGFGGGGLGADPVKKIQNVTGLTTLILLFVTLAVTPLRRLTGWNEIIKLRRMIGLFAFFYAVLHAFTYFVFDQSLSLQLILDDARKHPRIFVGLAAFLLLIPLAVTSTDKMVRRLGGKRWAKLHQLIYVAAAGGVLHYLWVVKWDVREPIEFAWVFVALMAARVWYRRKEQVARARRPAIQPAAVTSGLQPELDSPA